MAICWSIFKHFLNGKGHAYKTSEKTLSSYFLNYCDIIAFWKSVLPDPFYSLLYENLTEDQERQTRQLLEYCGLEWEEKCLNFHDSERVVRTFSNDQVRKNVLWQLRCMEEHASLGFSDELSGTESQKGS